MEATTGTGADRVVWVSFTLQSFGTTNFSATSRREYDDYVLYSSSNFAAPRNFLGEREITQNSWRWVSRRVADGSDDPFVLPFSNCDLLQKVSRVFLGTKVADATGRHRCTMRTPQRRPPFIILEMWSVRWARNLSRGEWCGSRIFFTCCGLFVCQSVCLHRNERFCVQLVLMRKSAFHARIPGFETHLVKRIKHNSQCCKANERSLKRQWEVFMIWKLLFFVIKP